VDVRLPTTGPQLRVARLRTDEEAARTYGISGPAIVLVRPDNYIGLIDEGPAPSAVSDYLTLALGER